MNLHVFNEFPQVVSMLLSNVFVLHKHLSDKDFLTHTSLGLVNHTQHCSWCPKWLRESQEMRFPHWCSILLEETEFPEHRLAQGICGAKYQLQKKYSSELSVL